MCRRLPNLPVPRLWHVLTADGRHGNRKIRYTRGLKFVYLYSSSFIPALFCVQVMDHVELPWRVAVDWLHLLLTWGSSWP